MKSAMRKQAINVQPIAIRSAETARKSMFHMKSAMRKQTINVQPIAISSAETD